MGGFNIGKRSVPKSARGEKEPKKPRREPAAGTSSRGVTARRGRGQKRNVSLEGGGEEEEEEVRSSQQRHVFYEDDDEEDALAGYREPGGRMIGDIWIPPRAVQKEHELKGERLIIEKIVCQNFKSYGGQKEMGPFHKSFSAVVGPNGNGKSNIIDSLLFVFGYRSTKIRCKKMSLLIHQSELLPDVKSCSVAVHFVKVLDEGDEDTAIEVPNSNIVVMRSVDKNNVSIYRLNGRVVQFHEIAEFLKENGVDIVHNRFLILQGEVESISQLPPKRKNQHESGLLEFLEEVIGTKRYAKCLNQLEEQVEKLNFNRESKLLAVDIVEKELMALKEPVSKAKEFLRQQNTLIRTKHQLQQYQVTSVQAEMECLETEKKEAEDRVAVVDQELVEVKSSNSGREKDYIEKEKLVKGLEQEGNRIQKTMTAFDAQFTKIKDQIKNDNTQRKTVMKEITTKEKDLEVLEELPTKSAKELKDLEKRKTELDRTIPKEEESVKKEMVKIESEVERLSAEGQKLTKTFADLKTVRDSAKKLADTLESEVKIGKERETVEEQKLATMTQELEDLKMKAKENERNVRSSLGNKVGALEKELDEKKQERNSVQEDERRLQPELERARAAYADARQTTQDSQTDDQIYKAFFREKSKGRLTGVYGRLRDLATIDEKFNVAATVSSGLWDHWVVDNEVTGEEAINFLREQQLPFQNFQCLSKLQRYLQSARRPFTAPRNSHRLFDLIKVTKPEVTSVFYKALSDGLVADNLDIGSQIAYTPQNRSRVATLAGEIIDPNGAMTGGGSQRIVGKLNGKMAARLEKSMSERDVTEIKDTFQTLNQQYNDLLAKKQGLEKEIQALTLKFREAQDKMNAANSDPETMRKRIEFKAKQVTDQTSKLNGIKQQEREWKKKEEALTNAKAEYEETVEPCTTAEAAAKKVESKLKSLRGEKTKGIRKNLEFSLDQRKKVVEDITRHTIALKNYEANHAKLENTIESLKSEQGRLEGEMRELKETKDKLEAEGVELLGKQTKIKEDLEESKKELQKLKKSLAEFNKQRTDLENRRGVLAVELSNVMAKYKGVSGRVDSIKRQMAQLKLEEIPNEEVNPLVELSPEELAALNPEEMEDFVTKTTQELKNQTPNLLILDQYKQKVDEFVAKVSVLDDITAARDKHRDAYVTTVLQRMTEFMSGFAIISLKLKEMFRMISMGGDAELDLVDSSDPYSLGINFCVRPAGKSWKNISHLSGGEKTLSSLALIFALHHFKPSPFYVMDEIDAALDFKNVSIIANYIKDRTKFTQFVIVSLRANMFELADSMLGIIKVDNMSYAIHLGVSRLLTQLRIKFVGAGRPFPFENEYMANNRCHRQQQMMRASEIKKQQEAKDCLFNANYSIISEVDEDLLTGSSANQSKPDVTVLESQEQQPAQGSGETGTKVDEKDKTIVADETLNATVKDETVTEPSTQESSTGSGVVLETPPEPTAPAVALETPPPEPTTASRITPPEPSVASRITPPEPETSAANPIDQTPVLPSSSRVLRNRRQKSETSNVSTTKPAEDGDDEDDSPVRPSRIGSRRRMKEAEVEVNEDEDDASPPPPKSSRTRGRKPKRIESEEEEEKDHPQVNVVQQQEESSEDQNTTLEFFVGEDDAEKSVVAESSAYESAEESL